ncbi:MAG: hypothetical protein HY209_05850 [Candidatus Omnitrophica bacterium]|nr:hypothetical protein [Candidatus Omnitrophota bacterium]
MTSKRQGSGFSLLEILLVAAILSYSLSVILTTFITSVGLDEASRNLTTATSHAQYVMESVKNTAFANIATSITSGTWNWITATVTSNGLAALNSESIATTYSGTNPLTVTVTVSWNDTHARSRTKVLQTLMSG